MSSWGSGADLWGSDSDSRFGRPRIDDGMLEVVGVTGVVHMVSHDKLALSVYLLSYIFVLYSLNCANMIIEPSLSSTHFGDLVRTMVMNETYFYMH